MKKEEIRIRDPFILPDQKTRTYYMYGTTDPGDGIRASRFGFAPWQMGASAGSLRF